MKRVIPIAIAATLAAAASASAPAPAPAAAAARWSSVSTVALTPGSVLRWYRQVTVAGQPGTYRMVVITWPLGDARYAMRTALPGGGPVAGGWLPRRGLASWASAGRRPGLVAAITPGLGSYQAELARPSGLVVRGGVVLHVPTGVPVSPSVGFTTADRMVFGTPAVAPLELRFASGGAVTVGALEGLPAQAGSVGLYRRAGETVAVPAGYAAAVLATDPAASALTLDPTIRTAGQPVVVTLHQASVARTTLSVAYRRVPAGQASVTVPANGAVLVMAAGGSADRGLSATSGSIDATQTDPAWRTAREVMGGKPLLVSGGIPIAVRPMDTSPSLWSGSAARAAIGRTSSGRGIMAVVSTGNRLHGGITLPAFGRLLAEAGVTDAIGMDGGPVPELFTPRYSSSTCAPLSGFCYRASTSEFAVPAATVVSYTR